METEVTEMLSLFELHFPRSELTHRAPVRARCLLRENFGLDGGLVAVWL